MNAGVAFVLLAIVRVNTFCARLVVCGWFPLARHIIPAATKWDTWHQLDADEEAASSAQARRRWPAEAIFSRVMQAPALQGKIPFHFLPHVDGAFLVACFDVLLMDFNVVPVAWAQCVADLGSHGLAQYPGLHLLAYLVNRSGASPQATSDTNDASSAVSAATAAAAAAATAAAAAAGDVAGEDDHGEDDSCPNEDAAVTAEDDKEDFEFVDRILTDAEWDEWDESS